MKMLDKKFLGQMIEYYRKELEKKSLINGELTNLFMIILEDMRFVHEAIIIKCKKEWQQIQVHIVI